MAALTPNAVMLGTPESLMHQPSAVEMARLLNSIQSQAAAGGLSYIDGALSDLNARTGVSDGQFALVLRDGVNAGVYERVGGSWVRNADIPALFVESLAATEAVEAADAAATSAGSAAGSEAAAAISAASASGSVDAAAQQAGLATSAAQVAGAPIYSDTTAGVAGVSDGEPFFVPEDDSLAIYFRDGGVATLAGRLGAFMFDRASDLLDFGGAIPLLSFVQTREGGFAYQVALTSATDHHIETAGGVKLYALPNAAGVISTEQLGWSDGDDVTDSIVRFWPRFQQGQTFLICHNVDLGYSARNLTLPYGFTIRAKKPKVDGFNYLASAWPDSTNKFNLGDYCTISGLSITTDYNTATGFGVDGTCFGGGNVATERCLINSVIENCMINLPTDGPIRFFNPYGVKIRDNDILDGAYAIQFDGSLLCRIERNRFDGSATLVSQQEQIKTARSGVQGNVYLYIGHNEFRDASRDGIDLTGAMQYGVIENNLFLNNGGGVDVKTIQEERSGPFERNFHLIIRNNRFVDSSIACMTLWAIGTSSGHTWTDPTDDEAVLYGSDMIISQGNIFERVGAASEGIGITYKQGNFISSGDTFLGGAFFSGGNLVNSWTIKDAHVELVGDSSNAFMKLDGVRNANIHFRMLETREPVTAGVNYIRIEDCENVNISGHVNIRHEGMDAVFAFFESCANVNISMTGQYTGGGTAPYLVYLYGSSDASAQHTDIRVTNCDVSGFSHILRMSNSYSGVPATGVVCSGNRHRNGTGALINFLTLSNRSDVNGMSVTDNVGDGTTALWQGTTTDVVWDAVHGNHKFVGSNAVSFADLPASPYEGQSVLINDSTTTAFRSVAAGGGVNTVEVTYIGTDWLVTR